MEQMEFRTFLLQKVANELTTKQFEQLKFVLKGFISSGTCEEMKEVCHYFEELERRLFLTPTNLGILKKALDAIGRPDLVEEIEKKEQYFTDLFSPQVKAGDNLERREYDAVCDGIEKAAGNLKASGRSGPNTPDLQKQLKSTTIDNEDEVRIQQFTDTLPNSDNLLTAVPTYGKQKGGPPHLTDPETGSYMATPTPQYPQTDMVAPLGMTLDEAQSNSSEDVPMTSEEDPPIASNPEGKVNSFEDLTLNKPIPKEPSESTEIDGTSAEKMPLKLDVTGVSTGAKSSSAGTPPIMSSHQELGDDYVTDGNEDKKGESQEVAGHKKTTSQGADCHSSQHDYGGARPKQISSGSTKQNAKEQVDQVTSTDPHGTMVEEKPSGYGAFHPASITKEPIEDECTSPTFPIGTIHPTDFPMGDTKESEPSSKKAKSTQHVTGQEPSSQKSQHPPGAYKGFPSSEGTPGWPGSAAPQMGPGLHYGALPFGSAAPQTGMPNEAQQLQMLQQILALQQSCGGPGLGGLFASAGPSCQPPTSGSAASTTDSPMYSRSYDKGGYSVAISRGTLYKSTDYKGVVMMESGAQFHIAIANNNVHAAEVDITFGGMYLGVWVVEANRSLSNALIIEGSAWAQGRLTYFSASDPNRPTPNEAYKEQPEFSGIIELEFKPEILMLRLLVQHVRKELLHEIFMPDYKTATVGDLKKVINETLRDEVSCLVKNSSEILQEDKTMSSLALENNGEVIQVLYMKEELLIESAGKDPVTMMVDPFDISPRKIKDFIAQEIKILVTEQRVCFEGQDIEKVDSLLIDVLVKSKKTPVLKVDKDRAINIKVQRLPDKREHKVEMNWFETVDALKKKMEALQICESSATLTFNDKEIKGREQLIDLGFKNQSEVIVQPKEHRSSHRGSSADEFQSSRTTSRGFGFSGRTRGFGGENSSAKPTFRGNDDYPSGFSTLRSGPEDMQHDCIESSGQEGIAMLYGNEKNVFSRFKTDQGTWKFSKEKKVVLKIQLIDKRTSATGSSASSAPPGRHRPKYTDGPMSTGTPPPVPE